MELSRFVLAHTFLCFVLISCCSIFNDRSDFRPRRPFRTAWILYHTLLPLSRAFLKKSLFFFSAGVFLVHTPYYDTKKPHPVTLFCPNAQIFQNHFTKSPHACIIIVRNGVGGLSAAYKTKKSVIGKNPFPSPAESCRHRLKAAWVSAGCASVRRPGEAKV